MRSDLEQSLSDVPSIIRLRIGDIDVANACRGFEAAGYPVRPVLREFIENFSEICVIWRDAPGEESVLSTATEDALDAYPGNVRIYAKRIGREVFPVGVAFETKERLLLADGGDIFLGGDAGIQRVGNGFEQSLRALLEGHWDKTFF